MQRSIAVAAPILAVLLAVPRVSAADDMVALKDLSPGDEVRWHVSGGKTIRGTVDAAGSVELVLRPQDPGKPALRLSPAQIEKLEVVRGKRSHWGQGLLIGFVPGAFLGLLGATDEGDCGGICGSEAGQSIIIGGLATGTIGGLIGLAIKSPRFVTVAASQPSLTLNLAPKKGGFGAAVSLSF